MSESKPFKYLAPFSFRYYNRINDERPEGEKFNDYKEHNLKNEFSRREKVKLTFAVLADLILWVLVLLVFLCVGIPSLILLFIVALILIMVVIVIIIVVFVIIIVVMFVAGIIITVLCILLIVITIMTGGLPLYILIACIIGCACCYGIVKENI